MEVERKSIIKIFCVIREFFLGDRLKRANVYRMYKGYRICSSFFDEELKNLYEESSFLKEYFLALQERYYSLKESYPIGKAIAQKVDSVPNKSAQIAASSIQAICKRQFSDSQLNVCVSCYD